MRGIAENIRSMLHFSCPDEGPLRDYEKWPVDFIHGYADAMRGAMPYLQKTLDGITAGMAVMVNGSPLATAGAGAGAVTNNTTMNQTVNITSLRKRCRRQKPRGRPALQPAICLPS